MYVKQNSETETPFVRYNWMVNTTVLLAVTTWLSTLTT